MSQATCFLIHTLESDANQAKIKYIRVLSLAPKQGCKASKRSVCVVL